MTIEPPPRLRISGAACLNPQPHPAQVDAQDGQPLTTTLMDYAVPLARDLPRFEVEQTETPSPLGPLGVKGHGEAGTMAAPPAVVGAVLDALAPLGVRTIDPPLTPDRVWAAIRAAPGR